LGISDFLLFYKGTAVGLEVKFVKEVTENPQKKNLLKHPFSGPQQSFLHTLDNTKNKSFGLVAFPNRIVHLIPWFKIPKCGNWKEDVFYKEDFPMYFPWDNLDLFLGAMF
jgi:penicillin-binding protein-related factor A (putative recombinase)